MSTFCLMEQEVLKRERRSRRPRRRNRSRGGTIRFFNVDSCTKTNTFFTKLSGHQPAAAPDNNNNNNKQMLMSSQGFFFLLLLLNIIFFYVERNKEQHLAKTCVFFKSDLNKPGFVGLWVIGQRGLAQGNFGQI